MTQLLQHRVSVVNADSVEEAVNDFKLYPRQRAHTANVNRYAALGSFMSRAHMGISTE